MRQTIALLTLLGLTAPCFAVDPVATSLDLTTAAPSAAVSIFGLNNPPEAPTGDTFSLAPLVQDGVSAFFISDASPSAHTFDGTAEGAGNNSAGTTGDTFVVNEAVTLAGNVETITVQVTNVDAAGAPAPWVAAGVGGANGPFTSWRMDLGILAGGADAISNPGFQYIDGSATFSVFDSAGAPVGTFPLTISVPAAGASDLTGVAVVGLGGADIAGFDMAAMQMSWEMQVVPEPAALSLLGVGLLSLLGLRRRG